MYAASELLAIAMRIEENGEKFYRRAGEKTNDQEAQLLLFFLADQEEIHRQIFAGLLAEAETTIRLLVEADPVADQFADTLRRGLDHHPHDLLVTQAGTRIQRISQM